MKKPRPRPERFAVLDVWPRGRAGARGDVGLAQGIQHIGRNTRTVVG